MSEKSSMHSPTAIATHKLASVEVPPPTVIAGMVLIAEFGLLPARLDFGEAFVLR
jgi:hypothetical protein